MQFVSLKKIRHFSFLTNTFLEIPNAETVYVANIEILLMSRRCTIKTACVPLFLHSDLTPILVKVSNETTSQTTMIHIFKEEECRKQSVLLSV